MISRERLNQAGQKRRAASSSGQVEQHLARVARGRRSCWQAQQVLLGWQAQQLSLGWRRVQHGPGCCALADGCALTGGLTCLESLRPFVRLDLDACYLGIKLDARNNAQVLARKIRHDARC